MELNKYIRRELLLVGLCTLATLIGPTLWINVKFSFLYVIPGLVFSVICIAISSVIYKGTSMLEQARLTPAIKYTIGIILGYVPISWIVISHNKDHLANIFRIFRGEALLNFPFILGFLLLSVIFLIFRKNTVLSAIFKAGMLYFLPLFIVIKLMPLIPNSEGKVILGNIAVIYFFAKIALYED